MAAVVAAGVVSGGLLVGCASLDSDTYKSRTDSPKTLEIIDQTTGNVLWGMEIPVEHTLKTDMDRNKGGELFKAGEGPATKFRFKLVNDLNGKVVDEGEIALTGYPVRRLSIGVMPEPDIPVAASSTLRNAPHTTTTTAPATQGE
ncbi:MAG: hypothetical protein AAGI68_10055 [Planctomycetota bacterium]